MDIPVPFLEAAINGYLSIFAENAPTIRFGKNPKAVTESPNNGFMFERVLLENIEDNLRQFNQSEEEYLAFLWKADLFQEHDDQTKSAVAHSKKIWADIKKMLSEDKIVIYEWMRNLGQNISYINVAIRLKGKDCHWCLCRADDDKAINGDLGSGGTELYLWARELVIKDNNKGFLSTSEVFTVGPSDENKYLKLF